MPIAADDLDFETRLRVLLMSPPKAGKTTTAVVTSPGPKRVLLCEDAVALREAHRQCRDFDVEPIGGWNSMQSAIEQAKKDAEDGKIATLIVDPLSMFADRLLRECFKLTLTKEGNEDGRRAYPECTKRLKHLCEQLFSIQAHVIVICHYVDVGSSDELGGLEKTGKGIVPLLPGQARAVVGAIFHDVLWLDLRRLPGGKEERTFVSAPEGAWGPGCRNLSGSKVLPADIKELIKAFAADLADAMGPPKPAPRPTSPTPAPTTPSPTAKPPPPNHRSNSTH